MQQAASYIDRILRGDKPSELPVQAPTKFETVVIAGGGESSASQLLLVEIKPAVDKLPRIGAVAGGAGAVRISRRRRRSA
jgi:hypothetical protein